MAMKTRSRTAPWALGALLFCTGAAGAGAEEQDSFIAEDSGQRRPLHTVVPVYPQLARRERVEGDVQVCFNVDREGKPYRVKVRSSTNRIFEEPALVAARASTFEPLPPGIRLSGIKTCRTFRFRLDPVAIEKPQ